MKDTNNVLIIVSVVIGVVILIYFLTKKKKTHPAGSGNTFTGYINQDTAVACAGMQYGSCPSGGRCKSGDPTCYCVYECVPPWGTNRPTYIADCSAGSTEGFGCPAGYVPSPFIPN